MNRAQKIVNAVEWGAWIKPALLPTIILVFTGYAAFINMGSALADNEKTIAKHEIVIEELQKGIADIRTSQALTNQRLEAILKTLDKLEW